MHAQPRPFLLEVVVEVQGAQVGIDGICAYTLSPVLCWTEDTSSGAPGPANATRPPEVCQAFLYCLLSTCRSGAHASPAVLRHEPADQ